MKYPMTIKITPQLPRVINKGLNSISILVKIAKIKTLNPIAYVMGFQGIDWLERSEREKEEDVSTLIKNMKIKSVDHIADIGAGSGYHAFKMAHWLKMV